MADAVTPFATDQSAAAQAAIQANLTYRAVNNPETLTPSEQAYLSNKVVSSTQGIISQQQDAENESAKQQTAFSQPRNDLLVPRSEAYNTLVAQAELQKYSSLSDAGRVYHPEYKETENVYYDTSTAAGIAAMIAGKGGYVNPGVANIAISEGYTGVTNIPTYIADGRVSIDTGMHTEPIRDLSSGTNQSISYVGQGQTATINVPYGSYAQTQLTDAKIGIGQTTGELAIYQQPTGHYMFNLAGGAGRNALQSGMFTIGEAETPYVIKQYETGTANLPSGKGMSRLGSELYGGYVVPLDNRTMTVSNQLSSYANAENLANYVNPQGPNIPKSEAPTANPQYSLSTNAPAIQYMNENGFIQGSETKFPALPTTTEVGLNPATEISQSKQIAPGVFSTGSVEYVGSSGKLPVVPGSYSFEATTKPAEASATNFISNLYGNVVNTLGGLVGYNPNLETSKGFAETTTTEKYQVSLPQAYVSNAPKGYTGSTTILDITTVFKEKESSLYEAYNTQLSSAIPKLPVETVLAANMGKYGAAESFAIGAYEGASARPLDVIKYADIGALVVVGGGAIGSGVSALAAGTRAAPIVAAAGETAPGFFGTLYGYSVSERATLGFKDLGSASATRLGGLASTEVIPMLAGGMIAARPNIGYNTLRNVDKAAPELQQMATSQMSTMRAIPETSLKQEYLDLIPVKPITITTGRSFIVESTKVVSPEYGDITLSLERSLLNVGKEGKVSRISTAEDIFISPDQLAALTDTQYTPRTGTFGSTKVTEIIGIKDVYSVSGKQYTFDIGRSATVMKPEAFDYASPFVSAERILSEPARPPVGSSLKLTPEDIASITTEYAKVYSPEGGFAVTRIERIPASERLKFETGKTTEVTDLGSIPDYLKSGAILEERGRSLSEVGVATKTSMLAGETKTGFDIIVPSEAIKSEMFGPSSGILPAYESALKGRTIPKETHEQRLIKDSILKSGVTFEVLYEDVSKGNKPFVEGMKTAEVQKPSPQPKPTTPITSKKFKSSEISSTKQSPESAQQDMADSMASEKLRSISIALEQLREPVKKSEVSKKAESAPEVKLSSKNPIFAEYGQRRNPVRMDEGEEVYSSVLPSGMTRPSSGSLKSPISEAFILSERNVISSPASDSMSSLKQSTDKLSEIQKDISSSQNIVRTPASVFDVYRAPASEFGITSEQGQKTSITPFVSTGISSKTITDTITDITPATTPDIITDIGKINDPPPPIPPPIPQLPPIPIVLPKWSPGQGGYASGSKRYRKKIQVETSGYMPNIVEKESMKFFRAAGNGKIMSSSPSGKVTTIDYSRTVKKSRRK